jgi:bifunctional DNA-binding transcriptional regulator/antitoxin component of YhaV-PrlF toxin-antitoxin module
MIFKVLMITTKVQLANEVSKSIRVTIPLEVKEALGLQVGDVLAWEIDKKRVCIRKLE